MSLVTSFALNQNLGELNSPLFLGTNPANPVTPATRKQIARGNLGVLDAQAAGVPATPPAVNATGNITAAQVNSGVITSTTAAAVTGTLPTGNQMDTFFSTTYPSIPLLVGMATTLTIVNTGPNGFTLAAGTNFTIVGATAIATGTSGTYLMVRTAANTWVAYRE